MNLTKCPKCAHAILVAGVRLVQHGISGAMAAGKKYTGTDYCFGSGLRVTGAGAYTGANAKKRRDCKS